ncbi:hypothetical protein SAY87_022312 [Trapa incisa]|uniref:Uncharacterized protein n=1 Tax=Trapa incisa TaxID=236973 RepID=A0AAN7Q3Y3_9MYRT|nr:hypothetical protein SAY87_022312 [Trapa incisa]
MSFADIVYGEEKHDVARSFSALLQLLPLSVVNSCSKTRPREPSTQQKVNLKVGKGNDIPCTPEGYITSVQDRSGN